jgi:hypothetical protein
MRTIRRCVVSQVSGDRSHVPPARSPIIENPGLPRRGFLVDRHLPVADGEAGANRQGGKLIDRVAAGAPVRQLFLIQPFRHARVPFARVRADHRAGIEPAAIDTHGAAEAASNLEGGLDQGVAGQPRGDRLEIGDFSGADCGGSFRSSSFGQAAGHKVSLFYADKRPDLPDYCVPERGHYTKVL